MGIPIEELTALQLNIRCDQMLSGHLNSGVREKNNILEIVVTNIERQKSIEPACDASKIRIKHDPVCNAQSENCKAALQWRKFGFDVIPIVPGTKQTAVKWDAWLDKLTCAKIAGHWSEKPDHEIGFIVGDDIIVLDADSPEATVALAILEKTFDVTPNMVVKTTKGKHHYFKRTAGTFAKCDSHSTADYPERLDVKTGRSMVILPPSTGKTLDVDEALNAAALSEVGQPFIDAVARHNGRLAPRPFVSVPTQRNPSETPSLKIRQIEALLNFLAPNVGYDDWYILGMVIYHETKGSDLGLDCFNTWSSKCNRYKGRSEIESKWRSFKSDQVRPVTIGTLNKMVTDKGGDWMAICAAAEPQFERCITEVICPGKQATDDDMNTANKPLDSMALNADSDEIEKHPEQVTMESKLIGNPLNKYSLRGRSGEVEKSVVDSVSVLGDLALMGQATVFFAAPNTGKTLIAISLLIDAVKVGHIDPTNVYYLNMDDSGKGLLGKLLIAEEYNFHMLAEGYRDFNASEFLNIVRGMTDNDQARGVILILDTLKKFVDLMDKNRTSAFTNVIRPFLLKGGTVIALAHTNKHPGKDGKPIYGGVSDIMNDIDCAYTIAPVSEGDGLKVVEFVNIKRRGNVVQSAAYSYCVGNGIPYDEILLSVQSVDQRVLEPLKLVEAIKSDAEVISAVSACIGDGVNSKMKLADATAKRAGISRRSALQIIETYTGADPALHRWNFSVAERGAKLYNLLEAAPPAPTLKNRTS